MEIRKGKTRRVKTFLELLMLLPFVEGGFYIRHLSQTCPRLQGNEKGLPGAQVSI